MFFMRPFSVSAPLSVFCGAFQTVYHLTLHSIGLQVVVMRTRFKFVTIIVQYKEKSNESCTSFYYILEGSSTRVMTSSASQRRYLRTAGKFGTQPLYWL